MAAPDPASEARAAAATFRHWAHFWRCNFLMLIPFWLTSKEAVPQRAMLAYLAFVSILALVVTYDGKAEAAEARAEAAGRNGADAVE